LTNVVPKKLANGYDISARTACCRRTALNDQIENKHASRYIFH